ncbi:MAG: 2-succinyl-6-hydroxy-2,4-cyclohexadiene-1-carboxylate synthase [Chloroflexi bacterium]|nr:2-succinyl-6-hydroxy-2,4-cyclohexadiene-1-carboxylate synthase [Chloroflexota bacterium]
MALDALNGQQLGLEIGGEGQDIVAIHGFTGSASTWASFRETALAEYAVVCPDMLGHGASDSPNNPQLYDMEHTVHALEELLVRLKLQRVHWLGYSMGGRIALAAAIALPQRTASLTLESASPGLASVEERAARVRSDNTLADRLEKSGIIKFVDYWESLPLWASQARLPLAVRSRLREQRLSNNPAGLANSLRGIGTGVQPPLDRRLQEIRTPTLFIAGEEDDKFVAIAREMHREVRGSLLEIIPQAGHAAHLEQPTRFNRMVIDFLRSIKQEQPIQPSDAGSRLSP